ncbi:MAG: hypothetical protein OK438_01190 [Thaumarchaeota archaeon]|nr:hypothetical protein [Nitrososphaerota archaeon]
MSTNYLRRENAPPRRSKVLGLALASILTFVLLAGVGTSPVRASAATGFDNVQVFVQTSHALPYSYTLTAYNTSGYQVAYYQSNYPAAAMELPDGTYLFTVSATYSPPFFPCNVCASPAGSTANGSGTSALYIRLLNTAEYGYAVEQITGPSSFTIATENASALPTTKVSVHVVYANGTAAQGAWVYASVIGNYYYYGPNVVSNLQTGADGNVVLEMPKAPLLVTSYLSFPTAVPGGGSNGTTSSGGKSVNGTTPGQTTWVSLEGQTLILPPQTSGTITLQKQPVMFYAPIPLGVSVPPGVPAPATNQTGSNSAAGSTQAPAKGRIPGFSSTDAPVALLTASPTSANGSAVQGLNAASLAVIGTAAAIGALALVFVASRRRRDPSIVSA